MLDWTGGDQQVSQPGWLLCAKSGVSWLEKDQKGRNQYQCMSCLGGYGGIGAPGGDWGAVCYVCMWCVCVSVCVFTHRQAH